MSEVKRYVTTCDCMSEASWGDYVRHADYDALAARLADCHALVRESNEARLDAESKLDAALAELAALKGGREPVGRISAMADGKQYATLDTGHMNSQALVGCKLYTAPPAQASAWVAEGWKLVPVDPTPEMVNAALRQDGGAIDSRSIVADDYRAMLAAAPTPGASDGKDG